MDVEGAQIVSWIFSKSKFLKTFTSKYHNASITSIPRFTILLSLPVHVRHGFKVVGGEV